jgi:hypothetical protein
MANDNVKIIIQEVNETTPKGSGTSSDVAYVPGLAVDAATSKNVPFYVVQFLNLNPILAKNLTL